MATRRTTAPRKRPAPQSAGVRPPHEASPERDASTEQEAAANGVDPQQKVVEDFEAELRAQPDMDQEELEFILQNFKQAVQDVPLDAAPSTPDLESWGLTLNALVEAGAINEEDRRELARRFGEAFSSLNNSDVQIALEYAQRLERDGEDKALEWLHAQRELQENSKQREAAPSSEAPRLRQSVTQSRSRRLRGPPK